MFPLARANSIQQFLEVMRVIPNIYTSQQSPGMTESPLLSQEKPMQSLRMEFSIEFLSLTPRQTTGLTASTWVMKEKPSYTNLNKQKLRNHQLIYSKVNRRGSECVRSTVGDRIHTHCALTNSGWRQLGPTLTFGYGFFTF